MAAALLILGVRSWESLRPAYIQFARQGSIPPPATASQPLVAQTGVEGLAIGFTPEVMRWASQISAWSRRSGLPPNLIAAVMQVESCGDPQALSPSGALGLFQVMPFHFRPGDDPLDPDTNAGRGLQYLADGLRQAGGRVDLALAGYNGGHVQISRPQADWPAETQRYVRWTTGILDGLGHQGRENPGLDAWLAAGGSHLCEQASRHTTPSVASLDPVSH